MKSGTTPSPSATIQPQRRQAQALNSQALDYLRDGIFTCQLLAGNLTVTYGNRAFKEMLGLPAHERVKGRSLRSLIGGLLSPQILETLHRTVAVRQRLILTLPSQARAGERRFRLDLRPASTGAGWVGSLGYVEAAEKLELRSAHIVPTSESPYTPAAEIPNTGTRHILNVAPGLISLRSSDARFAFVNSAMAEFLGLDAKEIIGRRWSELAGGGRQAAALRLPSKELLEGSPLVEHDVALIDALGRERHFDITHRFVAPGSSQGAGFTPPQILSVATERLDAERLDSDVDLPSYDPHEIVAKLAQDLVRAEGELKDVAERIPAAIARWTIAEGGERLTFISEGAQRLTGHRGADILKEPELLFSGTDRSSRAAFRRAVDRARQTLAPFALDFPVRFRNSDERKWIRLSATVRRVNDEEVLLDGVLTDTTELKQKEHGILAARNQLHALTGAVPGVVWQIRFRLDGGEGAYLYVSDGSRELLGADPRECIRRGKLFEDRVLDEDVKQVRESLDLAIRNLSPWDIEFRIRDQHGSPKWVRAIATPGDAESGSVIFNGIITETTERRKAEARLGEAEAQLKEALTRLTLDVAERKRAQRALEQARRRLQEVSRTLQSSQRQLRDITKTIPGAVFQCVARDRLEVAYISEGARQLFGVAPADLKGPLQRLLSFCRNVGPGDRLRRLLALSRDLKPWEEELEILNADGRSRWLRVSAHGVRGADGVTYYHGVITDATDAKLAELRFADGEKRLQLALQSGGLGLLDWSIPNGRAIYNSELANMLGYGYDELGTNINRLHGLEHPKDLARKRKDLEAHLDGETRDFSCTYRLRTKSGEWRWVSAQGRVVERGANGGALRYVGTIQDVNDRVEAERRLEQQVVFSRLITKISSDFMSLKTADEIDRALSQALRTIARFAGAQQAYLCEDRRDGCMLVRSADMDSENARHGTRRPQCDSGTWLWLASKALTSELVQAADVRDLPDEAKDEREDLLSRGVESFLMVPLFIGQQSVGWLSFEFSVSGRRWDEGELSLFRVVGEIITQTISRRRGERALEAAETQVREITKAVPGAVAQVYRSPEGKLDVRYLSRTISGCSVEEVIADPNVLVERIDERDWGGLERTLERAAADLTPWQYDYRIRNQEGDVVWVSASAYPTRMPDGGTLFNGIAIDVTDRKRAEGALQRSEERFRVLYESTPVMMHSTDARGQIVNVNREWLSTLGYERSEVIGRRTEDFLTRASGPKLDAALEALSIGSGDGTNDTPCQMIRRDGEFIDVVLSFRAERMNDRFVGVSISTVNVSERNRALRALADSEERYRAVVRDHTDAICRFDRDGALQFASAPCRRFLGNDVTNLKGRTWYEWIEPAHRERIKRRLSGLSQADSLAQFELRMGAGKRWYQWTVRGFFSNRGALTGYQAVGRDIEELKTLEREIREISDREQQRIGHDLHDGLGQELTGVSLMLKTLEQVVGKHAPELRPKVGAVRDMVGQSIATTRALAQGLSPVHLERDGFAGALSQLAANTESVYGTPVRFSVSRGAPIVDPSVTTDLYRIAQEALNNAARHARARQITVSLVVDRDILKLEVADDGCGIPPDSVQTAGMGLKIMRYRANMIDASLDILPRQGGGTIVRCTLRQLAEIEKG